MSNSSRYSATIASVWGYAKLALGFLLLALLVSFVVQNAAPIRIEFLVWETDVSPALMVFLALLWGVVFGVTLSDWPWWRSSRKSSES
jgi:uncharacterized integral membrane protein